MLGIHFEDVLGGNIHDKRAAFRRSQADTIQHKNGQDSLYVNEEIKECFNFSNNPPGANRIYCGIGAWQPHKVGDILYVRETWNYQPVRKEYYFKTDVAEADMLAWKPSIHMPKEAARIFLRVTGVRAERLQEITEADAKAEGVTVVTNNSGMMHRVNFKALWDSTIKKADIGSYSWAANPWVWVIEFERVE